MVALARSTAHCRRQSDDASDFEADVLKGLSATRKRVPPKYFYDAIGSQLFDRITEQPEYYPTRCEMRILQDNAGDIAKLIPPGAALVEFGSGSNKKARILLAAAPVLAAYVPVDICGEMVEQEAAELRPDFPHLNVHAGHRRFHARASNCRRKRKAAPVRVGFFPGLHHRQFRAARGGGFPAQCREDSRARLEADHRRRSDQGRPRSSTPPITTRPASPPSSISICWCASTANSAAPSSSTPSSITPSSTASATASKCTSPA